MTWPVYPPVYAKDYSVQPRAAYGVGLPGGRSAVAGEVKRRPEFNGETPPGSVSHSPGESKPFQPKKLLQAVGLFGVGMLLHRLPTRVPQDGFKTILPTDWKVWARVLLGIDIVHKINQAFDLKLPPWLGALQAVAVINPLAVGFSKKGLLQTAVMAPVVALVVQGASWLHQKIAKPVQEQCQMSPIMSQIGVTLGLGVISMLAYPKLYKLIASTGIIGKELKEEAMGNASAFASTTFATCARACSPGSFICLSELADIVGSFGHWFRSRNAKDGERRQKQAPAEQSGHCNAGITGNAGRLA